MIKISDPSDCCGCSACASICNHNAITMEPDKLGFLYPKVNPDKCVDCSLCEKVCSFNNDYNKSSNLHTPVTYAVRHKDIKEIEKSRSGAAFIAISDYVLENGGVVYGVGYTGHFRVVHKRAINKEQRDEFRGSKYVQSDLTNTFRQVKEDLKNNFFVLFSGTPCQTSGLISYIGEKLREKLFIVDIVCHGVPSPFIWSDYINYLEKKENSRISQVYFRNKHDFGWSTHIETYSFKNRKKIHKKGFTNLFYKHIIFRHSCSKCYFCNITRPSDITLADYWGWEKVDSEFNADDKGVSLVLVNTIKGKNIFNKIQNKLHVRETRMELSLQPNLMHPSVMHPKRSQFEAEYIKKGFGYVYMKYADVNWQYKARRLIKKIQNKLKIIQF